MNSIRDEGNGIYLFLSLHEMNFGRTFFLEVFVFCYHTSTNCICFDVERE